VDFAVWCQLIPRVGLAMRFLFIGLSVSPSLPPPGRSPFRSWLQVVVSSFSCSVLLQGTFTPFATRPCWAHTMRCSEPLRASRHLLPPPPSPPAAQLPRRTPRSLSLGSLIWLSV
jgi:hypothetical protein